LGLFYLDIDATNYQHPINISWDSTILHAYLPFLEADYINIARIDNNYFFSVNNAPQFQQFDMTIDDHVFAPAYAWGSEDQFPMTIYLSSDPTLGYSEYFININLKIFPNPAQDYLYIKSNDIFSNIEIYDFRNYLVKKINANECFNHKIAINDLSEGIYLLKLYSLNKTAFYEKFIKVN